LQAEGLAPGETQIPFGNDKHNNFGGAVDLRVMSLVLRVLFWVAAVGTATSSIYCLMVVVAALRFGLRKHREDRAPADFLPPISVLKPMHGTEPGMEKNLQSFFELDYPEFELVFCARHDTDEGLKIARQVAAQYPAVDARFITCGEPTPEFHNAKVFSLARLDEAARYEHLITSDADVRVAKDYLHRMVQYMKHPEMGLASCLYIGTVEPVVGSGRLSSHVDAVGKSVEMGSGVMVADMLEGTKFALGPTMSLRKQSFQDAGGFEDLGQYYAEDYVLGNRLANKGIGVVMATHIIRLMVKDQPFWGSFLDQLRWMRSTRRSRPLGHLGTGLTFAIPFGIMGFLWGLATGHAAAGFFWLFATIVNRWLQAATVLRVLGDPDWLRGTLLYPLRDLLGGVIWIGSYGGNRFYYRGGIYVLNDSGTVDAVK
jgi:ceramide glucosyltransferase